MRTLLALATMLALASSAAAQNPDPQWTGTRIMEESVRRHQQFPHVYEEQTMILIDGLGNREVRRLRRFTRVEVDGTVKFLLVFDDPVEIRGVALLARRAPNGATQHGVYLPAFGAQLKRPTGEGISDHFLGTDFSIDDLAPLVLDDYRYVRVRDRIVEAVEFFVVDAFPRRVDRDGVVAYGLRRHLVRKDNFMVVQIDVYDTTMRFFKRITHHDLKQVDGPSWRANMIVANDRREAHRTLLKIDRRVYSHDYVPPELFEPAYLLANRHVDNAAVGAEVVKSDAERELMRRGDGG